MYLAQRILRSMQNNTVWLNFMIQCMENTTINYNQQSIFKYTVETLSLDCLQNSFSRFIKEDDIHNFFRSLFDGHQRAKRPLNILLQHQMIF